MDNEWKKGLRERFSDYSVPEPEGLWEGIEQGMAGKPRRRMLPVWLVSGAAVAAAVVLGVFLLPEKTAETPEWQREGALAESVEVRTADEAVAAPQDGEPVASTGSATVSRSVPFAVASRRPLLSEAISTESVPVPEDLVPVALPVEEPPVLQADETIPEGSGTEKNDAVSEMIPVVAPEMSESDSGLSAVRRPFRDRFSIGAYGTGGQSSTEQSNGYGLNHTEAYLTRSTVGGGQQDVGGMVRMLSANRASTFEAHHSAPFRAGVTAAFALTPHLSLVSGVNWTYLESEFEETAGAIRTQTVQELGYLGVPLRLEAGANVWKGLWLYAGAGGMVEKGLMGSSRTHPWVDGGQMAESKDNPAPDMGGLLWSVGLNAGAEYRYSPSFGLYFSPGIEYHFDNGAEIRSAYTEKPFNWNVNLGIRFHFGG